MTGSLSGRLSLCRSRKDKRIRDAHGRSIDDVSAFSEQLNILGLGLVQLRGAQAASSARQGVRKVSALLQDPSSRC